MGVDFDDDQQVARGAGATAAAPDLPPVPGAERHRSRGGRACRADHAGGRRRHLVAGAQAAEAQRRAGGAAADPVHAARAQQLSDPPRARRSLRGDRRGPGAGAGRARGRSRAVRGAAASVRGDDRHAAALRAHRAGRAPAPRVFQHATGAAADADLLRERPQTSSVCMARRTPGRRAARRPPAESCTGSRAAPAPARRSRRSSRRAGRSRPAFPDTSASRPNGWRRGRWDDFRARWAALTRADDVICAWGRYPSTSWRRKASRCRRSGSTCARRRAPSSARARVRRGLHGAPRRRRPDPFAIGRRARAWPRCTAIVDTLIAAA